MYVIGEGVLEVTIQYDYQGNYLSMSDYILWAIISDNERWSAAKGRQYSRASEPTKMLKAAFFRFRKYPDFRTCFQPPILSGTYFTCHE